MRIELEVMDVIRVFRLLERLHDFIHSSDNEMTLEQYSSFAQDIYPELRDCYYNVLWDSIPKELQLRIEDGEDIAHLVVDNG